MKRLLFFFSLVVSGAVALSVLPAAHAQTARKNTPQTPLSVDATVDHTSISIGDPLIYTVTVRHDPKVELNGPLTVPIFEPFEIRKVEDIRRTEDGRALEGKRFTLTSFRLGEFVLDAVPVAYHGPDGTGSQASPKIYMSVVSVQKKGAPAAQDIRPVKGVVEILFRYMRLILTISFIALVAALAGLLIARQLQAKPQGYQPRELLTPEEAALQRLHGLFDSTLLRQGKFREYFFSLSEIMRVYFEKRFLIFAVESTTDELIRLLKEKEIDRELVSQIKELLQDVDLAKFAKWKPEPSEVLRMNQQAEGIIKQASKNPAAPGPGFADGKN